MKRGKQHKGDSSTSLRNLKLETGGDQTLIHALNHFCLLCSRAGFPITFLIFITYPAIFPTLGFLVFFFSWGSGLLILLIFQGGELQFRVLTTWFPFWEWTLTSIRLFTPVMIWTITIRIFRAHSLLTLRIFGGNSYFLGFYISPALCLRHYWHLLPARPHRLLLSLRLLRSSFCCCSRVCL